MSVRDSKWTYHSIMGIMLVLFYLLTACSIQRLSPEGPLVMPTPSSTAILPSATPTRLPSLVPSTAAPSPTYTPSPPTITPRPTLTAEEERAFVRELLVTNGGCELPCWWGIMPEETTWQEVRNRLSLYYGQGISQPGGVHRHEVVYGDLIYPYPPPYGYYIHIEFTERDGVVQSIQVRGEIVRRTTPERFAQDWRRYSLDQVLTQYGEPSQVILELWPNPPEPYYPYRLFVFYDHLGILIEYEGPAIPGEPFRVCPEFDQVTHLHLWLRSPEDRISLLQLANLDSLELAQMLPLEKATGMNVETFYQTFKDRENEVCLESSVSVWPSH